MANKFVLIDQSIASIAGHHYEYAVHVLEAAQRAGYEPYLATHQRFAKSPHKAPWKTYALYRYGFWAAQGAPRFASVEWFLGVASELRFRYRLAYHYSMFGLLWAVRDRFGEFLLKQPIDRSHLLSLASLIPAAILLKLIRFIGLLLLLPVMLLVFLFRSIARLLKAGGFPAGYVRSLFADVADLARFQSQLFARRNQILAWWQQYRSIQAFRADTDRLMKEIDAGPGDVMFVPTVSAIELMGLSELLRDRDPLKGPSWHMLFRRDIYKGREADYASQDGGLNDLRQVMLTAKTKLGAQDVRFYTDTEELTNQHNRLGAFRFETVSIPHTHRPVAPSTRTPLTILYIGDARSEKGYHLIPKLVEDVWKDYVATGRVRFRIQSNFNIPQGEPRAVIARQQLELLASRMPSAIELWKQPMTSEQYKEFLLSGDINLLMYDTTNYYARSSGILVESLSTAMPVLAPAGSWLARQFQAPVAEYRRSLRDKLIVVKTLMLGDLRWHVHGNSKAAAVASGSLVAGYEAKTFAWVRKEKDATHMLLDLRLYGSPEALLFASQLDGKGNPLGGAAPQLIEADRDGRCVALVPLEPACARIWLAIGSDGRGRTVSVTDLQLDLMAQPAGPRCVPLSAVGAVYQHSSEITGHFRELVDHHEHYADTARQFSTAWQNYHNADRLVADLGKPAGAAQ